jgi:hypothetical protein
MTAAPQAYGDVTSDMAYGEGFSSALGNVAGPFGEFDGTSVQAEQPNQQPKPTTRTRIRRRMVRLSTPPTRTLPEKRKATYPSGQEYAEASSHVGRRYPNKWPPQRNPATKYGLGDDVLDVGERAGNNNSRKRARGDGRGPGGGTPYGFWSEEELGVYAKNGWVEFVKDDHPQKRRLELLASGAERIRPAGFADPSFSQSASPAVWGHGEYEVFYDAYAAAIAENLVLIKPLDEHGVEGLSRLNRANGRDLNYGHQGSISYIAVHWLHKWGNSKRGHVGSWVTNLLTKDGWFPQDANQQQDGERQRQSGEGYGPEQLAQAWQKWSLKRNRRRKPTQAEVIMVNGVVIRLGRRYYKQTHRPLKNGRRAPYARFLDEELFEIAKFVGKDGVPDKHQQIERFRWHLAKLADRR